MESSVVDRAAIDAEHAKQRFEQEAGQAVGAMPPEAPQGAVHPEELRVDGTAQLSAFDFGGKRATRATVTVSSGAIEVTAGGAYNKGDVIHGTFTAIVRGLGQKDKIDKQTGIVVECTQAHAAQIVDLTVNT
jgi:hypothetical protein